MLAARSTHHATGKQVHTEKATAASGEQNLLMGLGTGLGEGKYPVNFTIGSEPACQ